MKYIASWTLPYSTYREASARFLEGGECLRRQSNSSDAGTG